MSKSKFKLNRQGVRDFLRSEAMQQILLQRATEIQKRAGDGYEVSTFAGTNRANATVKATTVKAKKDNKKNNTLLKAVR